MVLTGEPDAEAYAALLRITGLPRDQFEPRYWADRLALDAGKITGLAFWQKFLHDAGMAPDQQMAEELNRWDVRLWTAQNPVILAWQLALKQRGLLTAILSNMGDDVLASVEREFDWIHRFDVLVWSCQVGVVKPDPAIYRHTLTELGVEPEEALFIDDKIANIVTARALGMKAIEFSTVELLRAELVAEGFDAQLPLPVEEETKI
jgi:putative hydrolase of the HAD superfamily